MYQNKAEDRVVTPAHLLLVPTDSSAMVSFLPFKNIGLNTLQESSAFAKIRNATKVYNSHLVHTPSSLTSKYHQLSAVFSSEDDFLTTSSFGIKKQHNLSSVSSLGNTFSASMLDSSSFDKFLNTNLALNSSNSQSQELAPVSPSALSLRKNAQLTSEPLDSSRLTSMLSSSEVSSSAEAKLTNYPTLLENINDNSDKAGLSYPITKLSSPTIVKGNLLNSNSSYNSFNTDSSSSLVGNTVASSRENLSTSSKVYNLSGPNSKVLLEEQSIRSHADLAPSKSNYNLSSNVNSVLSNSVFSKSQNRLANPFTLSSDAQNSYADYQLFNNIASSRSLLSESHSPVNSSNPLLSDSLEYDSTKSITPVANYTPAGGFDDHSTVKKSTVGEVFIGSREKTPKSINTAY